MKRLTTRFLGGSYRPALTDRSMFKTTANNGVTAVMKDLSASITTLFIAGVALAGCATMPQDASYNEPRLRSTVSAETVHSADMVVPKTTHTRFAVLPAGIDVGGPLLNSDDLRRGQDLYNRRDDANIALLPYEPRKQAEKRGRKKSRGHGFVADVPLSDPVNLAAIGEPRVVRAGRYLQCVPFARQASGVNIFGNANRWWDLAAGKYSRSRSPQVGAVLVMNGYRTTRRGHVAVVRKIVDSRTMVIDHSNWLNDGKIYLSAPVKDVSPNNDWSMLKVWYTPGRQWGSRTYTAKGFIHPRTNLASAR